MLAGTMTGWYWYRRLRGAAICSTVSVVDGSGGCSVVSGISTTGCVVGVVVSLDPVVGAGDVDEVSGVTGASLVVI